MGVLEGEWEHPTSFIVNEFIGATYLMVLLCVKLMSPPPPPFQWLFLCLEFHILKDGFVGVYPCKQQEHRFLSRRYFKEVVARQGSKSKRLH